MMRLAWLTDLIENGEPIRELVGYLAPVVFDVASGEW
jgi:hypothetical protein